MSVKTIETMLDWVEDHLEEEPSLPQMAQYVGYSEYYCSAKFHEYVGVPFKEYVFKRKLSCAASELVNTDRRIIEIAVQFGFSSHEAFARSFKRMYGYTPGQCRRRRPDISVFERVSLEGQHSLRI